MPILVPEPTPPAAVPAVSSLGARAYDYLPAYVPEADDGTVAALFGAFGVPVTALTDMLQDYTKVSDPATTPFGRLPWLAALAGVDLSTVADANKRAVVASTVWRFRGSLSAIRARVGETLTGAKAVEIVCPYLGSANRISVTTYASQTPDSAVTTAAIKAEIPAWMRATIVTNAAGQSYSNMAADYATYATMTATGKTYGTLSQEV